jgi:hypothetical protein
MDTSMSDDVIKTLLPAPDLAVFERQRNGSFTSIAPRPDWFGRLVADPTFPFLGHILEEANRFWRSGTVGRKHWGPVAEVDESGEEFHYKVNAVATPDAQFLIFELDRGSDEMRNVLQKVRTDLLATEQRAAAAAIQRKAHVGELRRAADQFRTALSHVSKTAANDNQFRPLTESGNDLLMAIDVIVQATRPPRR